MVLSQLPTHEDEWFIVMELRVWHRTISRQVMAWSSQDRAEAEAYVRRLQGTERGRLIKSGAMEEETWLLIDPVENYHYSIAHAKDLKHLDLEGDGEENG